MDFLQKPLAWFSNFYLRVQSKNSGRNNFFILLFRVFFGFWAKISSEFWPKNFKKFSKLPSKCPDVQFVAWNLFSKDLTRFGFSEKTLQWFSNCYLPVQSMKSGRKKIFNLPLWFFSDFERKKIEIFGQKTSRIVKTNFCVCRWTIFRLIFIQKFWTVLDFLQKPLAWFSNFYLRVQSKNSGRNIFFILLFRVFSDFERNFFSDFWPKNFKKFSKLLLSVQRNSLWLGMFF